MMLDDLQLLFDHRRIKLDAIADPLCIGAHETDWIDSQIINMLDNFYFSVNEQSRLTRKHKLEDEGYDTTNLEVLY